MQKATKKKIPSKKKRRAPQKHSTRKLNPIQTLKDELKEALDQQTATSEILRIISSSRTDIQPVFDTIAKRGMRLFDGLNCSVVRYDGQLIHLVAYHGVPTAGFEAMKRLYPVPPSRSHGVSRAILERALVHIPDVQQDPDFHRGRGRGPQSLVAMPMLRDGNPIGAIGVGRAEPGHFSDRQIALLKTFADQAVIAIENVRLHSETKEALEQQTATSKILEVIASSPTDLQPVLDTVAENAARLCDAADAKIHLVEGNGTRLVASFGSLPGVAFTPLSPRTPSGRAILNREILHIHNFQEALKTEFVDSEALGIGIQTFLSVPMLREGNAIGVINIRRTEVRPFSEKQIALLKTFADQAVIAIENVRLFNETKEALEQQTATSNILGVIASSPTDIQPVLDTVAENAARLCEATDAVIFRVDGENLQPVSSHGSKPVPSLPVPITRGLPVGRAVFDRHTIHLRDVQAELETEYTETRNTPGLPRGIRTMLVTPLLREGESIGAIVIRRWELRPFADKQVALLKIFADQAVIAIENVRLFQELQARNRELTEALEQQTATSEILRVIASSPTDIQPVLDTMLANAVRLSGATEGHIQEYDGQNQRFVAHYNVSPEEIAALRALPQRPARESWSIRAVHEKKPIHIHDVQAEPDYHLHPAAGVTGSRTLLFVPLLRENTAIGTINIRRRDIVKPFTEREIELVKTFADQAVIAIENVRLFNEIKDALEQQTATSEILRVIASSPTDIQPVLDVIGESAARLCSAKDVAIRLVERNILRLAAHQGSIPFFAAPELPIYRDSVLGRAVVDGQLIHVEDLQSVAATEFPETRAITERAGDRTILAVPLMREDVAIGVIVIRRTEFNPFTDKQIALLKTFADQAVIAIENVRLFQELQAKNRDLTEALEQQTATSEVLKVISRSTFDLEPVLETLIENATNLCDAEKGSIARPDGDVYRIAVSYGNSPESKEFLERNPIPPLGQKSVTGRVISERRTVHTHDVLADPDYQWSEAQKVGGFRTILGVPMLRDGIPIGVIAVWRNRVQPFTEKQIELARLSGFDPLDNFFRVLSSQFPRRGEPEMGLNSL